MAAVDEIIQAVKPWEVLGETQTPDGTAMALTRRDREYVDSC